jgi:hypothetical protein
MVQLMKRKQHGVAGEVACRGGCLGCSLALAKRGVMSKVLKVSLLKI